MTDNTAKDNQSEDGVDGRRGPPDRRQAGLVNILIKALIAFAFIGFTCAGALLAFGIVLQHQADTAEDLKAVVAEQARTAEDLKAVVAEQARAAKRIQSERYFSLLQNCLDQNKRNRNVSNRIDDAIAAIPPPRRERAEKSSGPFRLIIAAAVPFTKDCAAYANSRVKENP